MTTATVTEEMACLGRQLQVVCAQVEILTSWLETRFGVRLVNKDAEVLRGVWQTGEIEEMAKSLGFAKEDAAVPQRKKRGRPRGNKNTKDARIKKEDPVEMETGGVEDEDLNPQDFVETIYVDEKRPKRLSRSRVNYSEDTASNTNGLDDSEGSGGGRRRRRQKDEETQQTSDGGEEKVKKTVWNSSLPKQCDECGKVLKGTSTLKLHKMMHADERPHICEVCGNKFRFRRNLKVHMMAVHTGERPLQCSFCGRKFYAPKDLRIHERTHTGEKPYPCTVCPKRFNVKEHLTMHMRVHTGEKPYKCVVCDKAFSQANSLRIHKKIHTRDPSEVKRRKGKNPSTSSSGWKEEFKDPLELPQPLGDVVSESDAIKYDSPAVPPSANASNPSSSYLQEGVTYTQEQPTSSTVQQAELHNSFPAIPGDNTWRLPFPSTAQLDNHHHQHIPQNSLRFGTNSCRGVPSDPFPPPEDEVSPQNDPTRFLNFYSQNHNHQ